jgi:hypothetical protein
LTNSALFGSVMSGWGGTCIYVADEVTLANPVEWSPVALNNRDILDVVRARIVWISREMEFSPAGSPEQAG